MPSHDSHSQCIEGVQEFRYDVKWENPILFLYSTIVNSRKAFKYLISQQHIDCINCHQPFSTIGITGYKIGKHIKKIYTCHSLSFEEYTSRNPKPFGAFKKLAYLLNIRIRKWMERRTLRNSDHIIVLSQYTKLKLNSIYGIPSKKISIFEGGVDTKRFIPVEDKETLRKTLEIPVKQTVLFTLRNLVTRMGLENLIDAFARVLNEVEGIHLVIGGEGILREKLLS